MRKTKTFWLLIFILIIAGFLRFYKITHVPPGLYPDEAMNGNNALEALKTSHFKVFYPENNGREGLLINIQALFLKIIGKNEPWVLRLPSAIFGTLTVLGIFFLAKELFRTDPKSETPNSRRILNANDSNSKPRGISNLGNWSLFRNSERVALLASFFLATSFWHINFSRMGFRAVLAPFFLIWAVYFFLLAIRKSSDSDTGKRGHFLAHSAGFFYGLGFYTYIAYRVTPLLFFLLIPFFKNRKGLGKVSVIFLITTFVVALPIGLYYLQHPSDFFGRTSEVSVFNSPTPFKDLSLNIVKTLGMFNLAGDLNWRHNYSGSPELYWPVGILFIIGLAIGLKKIIKRHSQSGPMSEFSALFIFLWFALAALPVVISDEGIPHALRSILLIPPAIMLAAAGGVWLYDKISIKYEKNMNVPKLLNGAVLMVLALIFFNLYYIYFDLWAKNSNVQDAFSAGYVEIGRTINKLPIDTPKYVIVEAEGVDVRGLPMPTQTTMFITDTFLPQDQQAKNVHYVLPNKESGIPAGSIIFYIK